MHLTSSAFHHGESIPPFHARKGSNKSPPLRIEDVPPTALSLVLIVDDPDAPRGTFTHWVVYNLDPKTTLIEEGRLPREARQGTNSWNEVRYGGPQPPSGEHRYFFKLYALNSHLDLPSGASRGEIEKAMRGRVLASAEVMGRFAADRVESVSA